MMKSLLFSAFLWVGLTSVSLLTFIGSKALADDECGSQAVGVLTGAVSPYQENVTQTGCGSQNDPVRYMSQSMEPGAIFSSPATSESGAEPGTTGAPATTGGTSADKYFENGSTTK